METKKINLILVCFLFVMLLSSSIIAITSLNVFQTRETFFHSNINNKIIENIKYTFNIDGTDETFDVVKKRKAYLKNSTGGKLFCGDKEVNGRIICARMSTILDRTDEEIREVRDMKIQKYLDSNIIINKDVEMIKNFSSVINSEV